MDILIKVRLLLNTVQDSLGGTARWLQLQPSSSWPRQRKQQNVFALYHSYNRAIFLGFIWILNFHLQIVLVRHRRYLIPIRCNNGKRKIWPWRWLHHFVFSPDDGCTRWWRWLHHFRRVIFDTHSRSLADKYAYRLYDCCQVWYV